MFNAILVLPTTGTYFCAVLLLRVISPTDIIVNVCGMIGLGFEPRTDRSIRAHVLPLEYLTGMSVT